MCYIALRVCVLRRWRFVTYFGGCGGWGGELRNNGQVCEFYASGAESKLPVLLVLLMQRTLLPCRRRLLVLLLASTVEDDPSR